MASVHKDQALPRQKVERPEGERPSAAKPAERPPIATKATKPRPSTLPLKIFVAFVSLGLVLSSLLGVTIGLNNRSTRRISILMLVAGAFIPLILLVT
jgi:hypothetical protein